MSWLRRAPLNPARDRRVLLHPVLALRVMESPDARRDLWRETGRTEVLQDGLPYLMRPCEAAAARGSDGPEATCG